VTATSAWQPLEKDLGVCSNHVASLLKYYREDCHKTAGRGSTFVIPLEGVKFESKLQEKTDKFMHPCY
jgi:hypothetical protein